MNNAYEILPESARVCITYQFHPTYEQWAAMMNRIFADPRFQPGFDFLFDKRQAGQAASTEYAESVARFYRQHSARMGRCAIVVDGPLAYGMSRVTEGYCPGGRLRVFVEIEEALAWLQSSDASPSPPSGQSD
jgi:hypothetical protein